MIGTTGVPIYAHPVSELLSTFPVLPHYISEHLESSKNNGACWELPVSSQVVIIIIIIIKNVCVCVVVVREYQQGRRMVLRLCVLRYVLRSCVRSEVCVVEPAAMRMDRPCTPPVPPGPPFQ